MKRVEPCQGRVLPNADSEPNFNNMDTKRSVRSTIMTYPKPPPPINLRTYTHPAAQLIDRPKSISMNTVHGSVPCQHQCPQQLAQPLPPVELQPPVPLNGGIGPHEGAASAFSPYGKAVPRRGQQKRTHDGTRICNNGISVDRHNDNAHHSSKNKAAKTEQTSCDDHDKIGHGHH